MSPNKLSNLKMDTLRSFSTYPLLFTSSPLFNLPSPRFGMAAVAKIHRQVFCWSPDYYRCDSHIVWPIALSHCSHFIFYEYFIHVYCITNAFQCFNEVETYLRSYECHEIFFPWLELFSYVFSRDINDIVAQWMWNELLTK